MTLPPGFSVRELPVPSREDDGVDYPEWINGLYRPTTLDFAPDGKMFVGEWLGRVKVFDSKDDPTPTVAIDISEDVHTSGDRGLLGMKLDPRFGEPGHDFIYLSYSYDALNGNSDAPIHEPWDDGGDKCAHETPSDCVISGRVVRIALDPDTGLAVPGPVEPPQDVLVQSWCQQFASHSMGDIEFDSTGALLVSGGDGASFDTADYGQFENPCGDPVDEGGSLRTQDVRTGGDQTDYNGAIIRIDPATGEALPDNPLYKDPANPSVDNPDVRARRILAYGFRNPFRFEVRPGTNDVYIGDVGQGRWDELDRLTSPPAPGQGAPNFGWPCFEGGSGVNEILDSWQGLEKPLCDSLYEDPELVTPSFWAYGHNDNGHLFEGDACNPYYGAAFSGLVFYEPDGVAAENLFPPADRGALFMSDAARGCVWVMHLDENGEPDPTQIENFATSDDDSFVSVVDLVQGPDGALYGPNFYGSRIEEFHYSEPPEAKLEASKIDGPIGSGFDVDFDATASTDPKAKGLTYEWDLDGDGGYEDQPTGPTASSTYLEPENVTVRLRIKDVLGRTDVAALTIYPGDLGPPQPQILDPEEDLGWAVGDTISYSGTATDPGGETLASGDLRLRWVFNVRHCPLDCHTHPFSQAEGTSGTFIAPPHEYPSHLRLELTATDSRERSTRVIREVNPKITEVRVSSQPPGLPVTVDGKESIEGPFRYVAGTNVAVSAPPTAFIGGAEFAFVSWSDGGAPSHQIAAFDSQFLIARYRLVSHGGGGGGGGGEPAPPGPDRTGEIRLRSRPDGVSLRLGASRGPAPVAAELPFGSEQAITAPHSISRDKRRLGFVGWRSGGQFVSRAPRTTIVVAGYRAYLAVYKPRRAGQHR